MTQDHLEEIESIQVTRANLPNRMAIIRFKMEAEAGHPLPLRTVPRIRRATYGIPINRLEQ